MKIALDAMGGDNAPLAMVEGAAQAVRELGVDVVLVGREEEIRSCLASLNLAEDEHLSIRHAAEVVEMEDDPATATRRKKDSSMTRALEMVRDGEADACVSAGSTGALLTGATLIVKRVRGIRRAALCPVLPNGGKGVLLIDCGANAECSVEYLTQFAVMGSFYSERVLGCDRPRVALLNVGTEDTKGGALQKETFAALTALDAQGVIHFIGNAEGSELLSGRMDVLVTDGFSGNVLLKGLEGAIKTLFGALKGIFYSSAKNKLAAAVIKKDLYAFKKTMDVSEIGGTALLGISRPVIKAHGNSDARAVFSAIRQAVRVVERDVCGEIVRHADSMKLSHSAQAES